MLACLDVVHVVLISLSSKKSSPSKAQLAQFIVLKHAEAECFFEACVSSLLSLPDVVSCLVVWMLFVVAVVVSRF